MINANKKKCHIYPPRIHSEENSKFLLQLLDQQDWTDREVASYVNAVTLWDKPLNVLQKPGVLSSKKSSFFPGEKKSFSVEKFYRFQLGSAGVCKKVGIWKQYCSFIQSVDPCAIHQHGSAVTLNHVLGLCGILRKLSINRTTCLIKHRRSGLVNIDFL
ncbi:hypothetical protein CEXT_358201 [Caerostris extrusa]|uniref:Uncharacterized protein n=1 Tax=Caerostris extrusa TaxID=172846 RepID=A0AAV4XR42_CAEEX|nr:hypothetical protein CEXT_358201 [Caerostris extrusa]